MLLINGLEIMLNLALQNSPASFSLIILFITECGRIDKQHTTKTIDLTITKLLIHKGSNP